MKTDAENIKKYGQGLDWNFKTENSSPTVKLTKKQVTNFVKKTEIKRIIYYTKKGSEKFVASTNKAGVILAINHISNKHVIFRVNLLTDLIFIDQE
jgi:hypothetical protein